MSLPNLTHHFELALLASKNSAVLSERAEVLNEIEDNRKRFAAKVLLHGVVAIPRIGEEALAGYANKQKMSFIGSGCDAIAYLLNRAEVLKVHPRLTFADSEAQTDDAIRRNMQNGVMRAYLGDVVLPQSSFVDTHPLIGEGVSTVQTLQPFCRIGGWDRSNPGRIFTPGKPEASENELFRLLPADRDRLEWLTFAALNLYEDHGILPDINGLGNLVIGTTHEESGSIYNARLYLIDGEPIDDRNPEVQQIILGQLACVQEMLSKENQFLMNFGI